MIRHSFRRLMWAVLLASSLPLAVAGQSGSRHITGTVIAGDRPLARATIALNGANGTVRATTVSDGLGHFQFRDLPEGRYEVSAAKPGYVTAASNSVLGVVGSGPIVLSGTTEAASIVLRLSRGAVITGVVTDIDGESVARQEIALLRMTFVKGVRTLAPVVAQAATMGFDGPMTDDRGEYRIYGLRAGEYLVVAGRPTVSSAVSLRRMTTEDVQRARQLIGQGGRSSTTGSRSTDRGNPRAETGQPLTAVPIFYPGTPAAAQALPVTIAAGELRTGVDIPLRIVPSVGLDGRVALADGSIPQDILVHVISTDPQSAWRASAPALSVDSAGRFRANGLSPGRYVVEARSGPLRSGQATSLWASATIDIFESARPSLGLVLQRTVRISGRVVFESAVGAERPAGAIQITLLPVAPVAGTWLGARTTAAGPDGRFVFQALTPGRYHVAASLSGRRLGPEPEGWTFIDASWNGRPNEPTGFEVEAGRDREDLQVRVSDKGATLFGTLEGSDGRGTSGFIAVMFPDDERRWFWQSDRVRTAQVATDGSFAFGGLPPGRYRLAVVTTLEEDEQFDPGFLRELTALSLAVDLDPQERHVLAIRIPRGSTGQEGP